MQENAILQKPPHFSIQWLQKLQV